MISYKDKYLFIHIPRTGGTSIEEFLVHNSSPSSELVRDDAIERDLLRFQHIHAGRAKKIFLQRKDNYTEFFNFSFVRNPWERLVSVYYYDHYTNLGLGRKSKKNACFADYIKRSVPKNINSKHDKDNLLFGTMSKTAPEKAYLRFTDNFWLFDDNDNMLMDFVGRFENLQNDFDIVCDKLKIPRGSLKKLRACGNNDSCPWHKERGISIPKYEHYTTYYDDETLEIVNCLVQKDADYFGYKFGE